MDIHTAQHSTAAPRLRPFSPHTASQIFSPLQANIPSQPTTRIPAFQPPSPPRKHPKSSHPQSTRDSRPPSISSRHATPHISTTPLSPPPRCHIQKICNKKAHTQKGTPTVERQDKVAHPPTLESCRSAHPPPTSLECSKADRQGVRKMRGGPDKKDIGKHVRKTRCWQNMRKEGTMDGGTKKGRNAVRMEDDFTHAWKLQMTRESHDSCIYAAQPDPSMSIPRGTSIYEHSMQEGKCPGRDEEGRDDRI